MTLQQVIVDEEEGWRWGDDGTVFFGRLGKRMALREGAQLDPRVFASLESKYGVVMAGDEVEWDEPESGVLHLD